MVLKMYLNYEIGTYWYGHNNGYWWLRVEELLTFIDIHLFFLLLIQITLEFISISYEVLFTQFYCIMYNIILNLSMLYNFIYFKKLLMVMYESRLIASSTCCGKWCLILISLYFWNSIMICLTMCNPLRMHDLHMGWWFLAMRWLWIENDSQECKWFTIVSFFLFNLSLTIFECFLIAFNSLLWFIQCLCHLRFRTCSCILCLFCLHYIC